MADLGVSWRDRRDGGALHTGYGISRSIDDYMAPVDRMYADSGPRAGFPGGASDLLRPGLSYEAGLSSGLGLNAGSSLGLDATFRRPGSLGSLDGSSLRAPAGRYGELDVGLGGGPASLGLQNGIARNPDLREDVLPVDASSTLYVDGLPLDCSRREAARILAKYECFGSIKWEICDHTV